MYAEVNVVSLIDVMMLMMVIFMITAPIMQGGVDLALPKAEARAVESRTGVTISVLRNGQIYVDDTRISLGEFRASVRTLTSRSRDAGVYLRVDRGAQWEVAVRVLAILQNAGIANVAIVAEPEDVVK
jgi:biopolymer transport protein ExbD/biopolymer transport protein TolR